MLYKNINTIIFSVLIPQWIFLLRISKSIFLLD